jgi:prolyl-tRNA synthetase
MRYSELKIETQRQAPARARTEGAAFLGRAGYIGSDGELSPLGLRTYARLEKLSQSTGPAEFFAALALPVIRSATAEFFFPISVGRQEILQCASCQYAARREVAQSKKAEPQSERAETIEKVATPDCNTIESLAHYLEISKQKTAKALMYTRKADGKFVFVVIRGDMQLSEAKLTQLVGEVRAATPDEIQAARAAPGYASPIGLTGALIAVDELIPKSPNLVAGANEAGYHFRNTNYGRDYTAELVADLVMLEGGAACPNCGESLSMLSAEFLADAKGFNLDNVLAALAEAHHDERGLTLPASAAPFDVSLLYLPGKDLDTRGQAEQLYESWQNAGLAVLFDDRDERAGVKFMDADLIGCPIRATVGERGMKDGMVELKARLRGATHLVPFGSALLSIHSLTKTPQ